MNLINFTGTLLTENDILFLLTTGNRRLLIIQPLLLKNQVAGHLKNTYAPPFMRGLTSRNLKYMRSFTAKMLFEAH
jgi:hypothetical protein